MNIDFTVNLQWNKNTESFNAFWLDSHLKCRFFCFSSSYQFLFLSQLQMYAIFCSPLPSFIAFNFRERCKHCAYINIKTSTRRSASSSCQSTLLAGSRRRSSESSSYDDSAIVELTSWLQPVTMLFLVSSFGFLSSLLFSWTRAFMNAIGGGCILVSEPPD